MSRKKELEVQYQELIKKKEAKIKEILKIEEMLNNKSFVSALDFASMYPSIIRLLNSGIETLVGFLEDDPLAYRKLGSGETISEAKERSKSMLRSTHKDTRFGQFVGRDEPRLALRLDLYNGKYEDADIDTITETPFEKFFLCQIGIFDGDEHTFTFQGREWTANELLQHFKDNNLSISGSGAVFSTDKEALIPSYLSYLFAERKKVKKIMLKHFQQREVLKKFKNAALEDGLY